MDEVSAIGVSALDVQAALELGPWAGESVSELDGTRVARTFTLSFDPNGSIRTERYGPPRREGEHAFCDAMQTETLVIEGTLTVSTDDGWITASGEAIVYALGAGLEQVWAVTELPVTPSPDLAALAQSLASSELNCDEEVAVNYHGPGFAGPLSETVGLLELDACNASTGIEELLILP